MEQQLSVTLTQTVSPQLIAHMEVLRMDNIELMEYIEIAEQKNPLIIVNYPIGYGRYCYGSAENRADAGSYADAGGMYDQFSSLASQLGQIKTSEKLKSIALFIINSLNKCGYLDESIEGIAAHIKMPLRYVQMALKLVQSLEPCGIGARCLKECLALQLWQSGEEKSLAMSIVQSALPMLSKNQYTKISRLFKVSIDEVRQAARRIRMLNPKPLAAFETTVYVVADLIVEQSSQNQLTIQFNDICMPRVGINEYYKKLLTTVDDADARRYIQQKMQQANAVVAHIDFRNNTLINCAQKIIEHQKNFFYGGGLKPLSVCELAKKVGVHESTVSRAIKNKHLEFQSKLYPLNSFFSNSVSDTSKHNIIHLIHQLIKEEDKHAPLSDNKLCDLLKQQNVEISRRTVTKYREKNGIQSSTVRKEG